MSLKNNITTDDVEWTLRSMGKAPERIFDMDMALAHLLINGVVFVNAHWWETDWPEKFRTAVTIAVNCNDVFAWGSADAEFLPHEEIENLYGMWRKDPTWGAAVWCMLKRNEMPQKPVERSIREAQVWDLDALKLRPNVTDVSARSQISVSQKGGAST